MGNEGYSSSYNFLLLVDIHSNENSVLVPSGYHYHDGNYFSKREYDFILKKSNGDEVLFDDYITIDIVKKSIRE